MEPEKLFKILGAAQAAYLVLLICAFIAFFLAFLSIPLRCIGLDAAALAFTVFGIFLGLAIVTFLIQFLATIFLDKKGKAGLALYNWEWTKRVFRMRIDPGYKLLPGEKEVIPMAPCYIESSSPVLPSFKYYPRDIIVTNFRIIIGSLTSIFFYQAESFREFNLWHPGLGELPGYEGMLGPLGKALGGNTRMKNISLESDKSLGRYLKVEPDYPVPVSLSICHPDAEKIFRIFSTPPKKA